MDLAGEQCMVASLPGAGTCKKVTRVYKGQLGPARNRILSAKAKVGLTARQTSRVPVWGVPNNLISESGSKDGFSDPRDPFGMGTGLLDKSYSGDNRLVASDSSH